MEIVVAISRLLSCACQPAACQAICQQLNYIRKVKEYEQSMQEEFDHLTSRGRDISAKLNKGKVQQGKSPKEEVTNWLENLKEIENDVNSLGSTDAHHMCCKGFCPNYYSRLKRSKKTEKILLRVQALREKGDSFATGENMFVDSLPETSFSLPATTLQGSSAMRKRDEILQCIMDPEVSKVGVYGMGGVGKTTIMRHIYNLLKEMRDFDIVMWVTVSSSFNFEMLQDKIAELLGCELSSSAEETSRAMVLHEAFIRRRKFVLILDDIWDIVSLQNVGIPEPDASNGSKIVWTTRSIRVCNSMESQREIKVEGLTSEEAWSLFKDKVGGEAVIMSPLIEEIARQVTDECAGLPLALITVGRAMRKTFHLEVWRNALQELKSSSTEQIDGMGKDVFGSLKFSYNRLSSDRVRSCFLYCALYPEDDPIDVDQLIEYWMAEGLVDEMGSIEKEKDKGYVILKELNDACMIESCSYDHYVRMHDLIRDLAINLTKEQPLFMVKAGLGLKESPKEEEWVKSLERVSLMENHIEAFEGQPNCPRLSTLLLQSSLQSTPELQSNCQAVSDTFFKHMQNLRVLDLSYTIIESLPDSLSDLMNLHALILWGCNKLKCLPSLAKLQKLRQLELLGLSSLTKLPHGLENLVKLRHLDISRGGWASFPSGALSKMARLEVLFMDSSGWRLSCGNDRDEIDNSIIGEILSLKKLTKFAVDFGDVGTFNCFINKSVKSGLLKHVDIFRLGVRSYQCYGLDVENESAQKVILPDTANYLGIDGCNFIQLSDIFGSDDLRQFIDCKIYNCNEMVWIQKDGEIVLPNLKKLRLVGLHSFKGLCKEKAHEETLKNLTHIDIFDCPKLKYFTPIDLLVNNLRNLKEISIGQCFDMEEIFSGNASAATTILLPKLKKMVLLNLPVLTSICQDKLVCDSLCEITVVDCPNMKKLPFLINNLPPDFERIVGGKKWWETLEWDDPQMEQLLHPFFQDEVMYADRYRFHAVLKGALLKDQMIKIGRRNMQENFQD